MPFRFLPTRGRFRQPSVVGDDGWFLDKRPVGNPLGDFQPLLTLCLD
jgi:hypothetical protein